MFRNTQRLNAPDGTAIAYDVIGRGPPLMLTNGITTSTVFWKYLRPLWAERYSVVTWDYPGHGFSEPARTAEGARIEAMPAIITGIMDTLGIERAVHVGWSVGAQVVLELARRAPERVRGLVTLFGPAGHALASTELPFSGGLIETVFRSAAAPQIADLLARFVRLPLTPPVVWAIRRMRLIGPHTSVEDLRSFLGQLSHVDPHTIPKMVVSCQTHSAEDVLPTLRVPMLIMAGGRDPFVPLEKVARPMHHRAPTSELVVIDGATHSAMLDYPQQIAGLVQDFIARRVDPA
jgi:pimeloyl-ACP methyl ester carboxylesterase